MSICIFCICPKLFLNGFCPMLLCGLPTTISVAFWFEHIFLTNLLRSIFCPPLKFLFFLRLSAYIIYLQLVQNIWLCNYYNWWSRPFYGLGALCYSPKLQVFSLFLHAFLRTSYIHFLPCNSFFLNLWCLCLCVESSCNLWFLSIILLIFLVSILFFKFFANFLPDSSSDIIPSAFVFSRSRFFHANFFV